MANPATESPPSLFRGLSPGQKVMLAGPNGCGKSHQLLQFQRTMQDQGAKCNVVFQEAKDSLLGLTVVGEAHLRGQNLPPPLRPWAHREVAHLSHGEARLVAVMLAISGPADYYILDEPLDGLQPKWQEFVVTEISKLSPPVLFVDHTNLLSNLATDIEVLDTIFDIEPPAIAPPGPGKTWTWEAATIAIGKRTAKIPAYQFGPGIHCLIGPNGCGKSVTLWHLAENVEAPAFLPQPARLLLHGDSVAGLVQGHYFSSPKLAERHPHSLSGGEMQQVALDTILGASGPIILDEPESHLDGALKMRLAARLQELATAGACIVMASQDEVMQQIANTIVEVQI